MVLPKFRREPDRSGHVIAAFLQPENNGIVGLAQPRGGLHEGVEYWLQVESRSADDLEHVARRGLVFERLLQITGALSQFAEQPRIFHCNDRLGSEILQQPNLLVAERSYVLTIDHDTAKKHTLLTQCHRQKGTAPRALNQCPADRGEALDSALLFEKIRDLDERVAVNESLRRGHLA